MKDDTEITITLPKYIWIAIIKTLVQAGSNIWAVKLIRRVYGYDLHKAMEVQKDFARKD